VFDLTQSRQKTLGKNYKWMALSNTTLAGFMVALDGSCVMIALPAIFRGINLNPLAPGASTYLLWLLMGYSLVLAVLVTALGRMGDMFGRVRIYNLGFIIFSIGSILLSFTWGTGPAGATQLILFSRFAGRWRRLPFCKLSGHLTDAFPEKERGMALGINSISFVAGNFLGIIIGGLLRRSGMEVGFPSERACGCSWHDLVLSSITGDWRSQEC